MYITSVYAINEKDEDLSKWSHVPVVPSPAQTDESLIEEAVKRTIEKSFKYYVLEQGVVSGEFDTEEEAIQFIEESDFYHKPVSVILGKELEIKQTVQLELDL